MRGAMGILRITACWAALAACAQAQTNTLTPAEIRLRTVEAIQATRKPAKAAPSAKKALAKRK